MPSTEAPSPEPNPNSIPQDQDTPSVTCDGVSVDTVGKDGNKYGPGLIPQPHGGALRTGGTPGQKGGTGRPRKAFKEFARELAEDPELQDTIRKRALKQATVLKMVLDHGAGVPAQPITIGADASALEALFIRLAPKPDDNPA